jgi:hypothetical protein
MKLNAAELAFVRKEELYITEKADGCRKLGASSRSCGAVVRAV